MRSPLGRPLSGLALAGALALAGCAAPGTQHAQAKAHAVMHDAAVTLQDFAEDSAGQGLPAALRGACAVLVFPHVRGAGFFAGWSAGSGVLMMREPVSRQWVGPAFFSLGDMALGPEMSLSTWQLVVVFRQCDTLQGLRDGQRAFSLRTSLARAAADRQGGSAVEPDIHAYAHSQGVVVGLALHFVELQADDDLAAACYGRRMSPSQALAAGAALDASVAQMRRAIAWAER